MARTKPYTERGIRRLRCFRCGKRAHTQWQVCADGNQYRPICAHCDVELNRLVLVFMEDPEAVSKMDAYETDMMGETRVTLAAINKDLAALDFKVIGEPCPQCKDGSLSTDADIPYCQGCGYIIDA